MDISRRSMIGGMGALVLGGLSTPASARGVRVERIQVIKSKRQLDLIGEGRILKRYSVRLGEVPVGPKRFQGDLRTPEGSFKISLRNPHSFFHRSLKIDYPHKQHRAFAAKHGRSAGGDIFIHGQHPKVRQTVLSDWTRGCIALSNEEMLELFNVVPVGCQVNIFA